MGERRFDIFKGYIGKDEVWLESVSGLENARQRMEQIASESPGVYFLFSGLTHSVLGRIDTRKPLLRSQAPKAKTA